MGVPSTHGVGDGCRLVCMALIQGLAIGQAVTEPDDGSRVVAIDPDLNTVEIEDSVGAILVDTIEHFLASHPRARSEH